MGDGFDIEHAGRTWTVGRPTGAARKALTLAVKQVAWDEVEALKEVSPRAYAEAKDGYLAAAAARQFEPGGAKWLAVTNGPEGNTLFLWSFLKEHQPGVTLAEARELYAARPDAAAAALAVLVPAFFDLLAGHPETPPEYRPAFREAATAARPTPTTTPG